MAAEIKVSQLPKASYTTPSDKLMVIQDGINKYIEFGDMLFSLKSSSDIIFGGPPKAAAGGKPAESETSSYPTNIIFKSETGTNLLYIETLGNGRVAINGSPTLANAQFQIHGNVKIENLYLDSYEFIRHDGSGNFNPISIAYETSNLIGYGDVVSKYSLGLGVPGQTKNIVFSGNRVVGDRSGTIQIDIDNSVSDQTTHANFQRISIIGSRPGSGCVLKFIKDTSDTPITTTGYWACVAINGVVLSLV